MAKNPKTGTDFVNDATVDGTVNYNLNQARAAYHKAQQQLGKKSLTLTITCGDDDNSHQVAEFIQGQLTSHLPGLKVTIKAMPFTAMLAYFILLEFGFCRPFTMIINFDWRQQLLLGPLSMLGLRPGNASR